MFANSNHERALPSDPGSNAQDSHSPQQTQYGFAGDSSQPPQLALVVNPAAELHPDRYFDEHLQRAIARAESSSALVALLAVEVDRLGTLTDTHGQGFCDHIMREMALALSRQVRPSGGAVHRGDRRFLVVFPSISTADAYGFGERIRKEIESSGFGAGATRLTISIGLALFPRDGRSMSELLAAADAGMLAARRNGGNRVILHSELEFKTGARREQRLAIALPVRIWGMDIAGALFEQNATTVDITTTGARIGGITSRLQRGCVIGVQHSNSKARYRIVWTSGAGSGKQGEIGLQLIDHGKLIWGRALPRIFGDGKFAVGRSGR